MSDKITKYAKIFIGAVMTGFGVSGFLTPNKIVNGGLSGLSTILYHTLGIETGISFFAINGILLLLALKFLGKNFVINTIFGATSLSITVYIFSYFPPVTNNLFLATILGSALYGMGIAIVLSENSTTGGTDILGRLIQRAFPASKIGSTIFVADILVVAISLITFKQVELVLYGTIALFISSFSINWFIRKLNISKLAFVISENGEKLAETLVNTSHRGVTVLDAKGAYTSVSKTVLLCALKEKEVEGFQKTISEIDPAAFIIFSESSQIIGKGFRLYR